MSDRLFNVSLAGTSYTRCICFSKSGITRMIKQGANAVRIKNFIGYRKSIKVNAPEFSHTADSKTGIKSILF